MYLGANLGRCCAALRNRILVYTTRDERIWEPEMDTGSDDVHIHVRFRFRLLSLSISIYISIVLARLGSAQGEGREKG